MKRTLLPSLCAVLCAVGASDAAPKPKKPTPLEPPADVQTFEAGRVTEFQGDDLSLVLRTLARQAKVSIVVSPEVSGTVTLRIENKTPREALEIIVEANGLKMDEREGLFYVSPKNAGKSAVAKTPKPETPLESTLPATLSSAFTPALLGFYEALLDFEAKPETARKIAKAKRALYDALIAEGFSKDEALQIILTDRGLSLPSRGN